MTYTNQIATIKDIPVLVSHHRLMFEEIYRLKGETVEKSKLEEMDFAYEFKLKKQIEDEMCTAWLIRVNDIVVSSGAVSLVTMVPVPFDINTSVAYIHSIYTVPKFRGNGFAGIILNSIIEYCKSKSVKRVQLSASDAGKHLYEKIGFKPMPSSMMLFLG